MKQYSFRLFCNDGLTNIIENPEDVLGRNHCFVRVCFHRSLVKVFINNQKYQVLNFMKLLLDNPSFEENGYKFFNSIYMLIIPFVDIIFYQTSLKNKCALFCFILNLWQLFCFTVFR